MHLKAISAILQSLPLKNQKSWQIKWAEVKPPLSIAKLLLPPLFHLDFNPSILNWTVLSLQYTDFCLKPLHLCSLACWNAEMTKFPSEILSHYIQKWLRPIEVWSCWKLQKSILACYINLFWKQNEIRSQ